MAASWQPNRDNTLLTRPILKFKLHFRKQDGRSRNINGTAYEILPRKREIHSELSSDHTPAHVECPESGMRSSKRTNCHQHRQGPLFLFWPGSSSSLPRAWRSSSFPLVLFSHGCSLLPLHRSRSKRLAKFSLLHQTIHTPTARDLQGCQGTVLHDASSQEATHKMLHWVLDLSVPSGQVRRVSAPTIREAISNFVKLLPLAAVESL